MVSWRRNQKDLGVADIESKHALFQGLKLYWALSPLFPALNYFFWIHPSSLCKFFLVSVICLHCRRNLRQWPGVSKFKMSLLALRRGRLESADCRAPLCMCVCGPDEDCGQDDVQQTHLFKWQGLCLDRLWTSTSCGYGTLNQPKKQSHTHAHTHFSQARENSSCLPSHPAAKA